MSACLTTCHMGRREHPLQTPLAQPAPASLKASLKTETEAAAMPKVSLHFDFLAFFFSFSFAFINNIFACVSVSSCSALCRLEILLKWRKIAHFFFWLLDTRRGRRKSRKSVEKADKKKRMCCKLTF